MGDREYSLREQIMLGLLARKAVRMFGPEYGSDDPGFSDDQYQQLMSSMRDDVESGKFAEQVTKGLRVLRMRCNGHDQA